MDMDVLFGLLGMLGFIVGVIMFIVACIKKSKKRISGFVILGGLILFIIGLSIPSSENTTSTENTPMPTEVAEETVKPIETVDTQNAADKNRITTEQEAIDAFKQYMKQQGFSDPYDKFQANENSDSFSLIAGHSYDDDWEQGGDFYNINKKDGMVEFVGSVDEILSQKSKGHNSSNNTGNYQSYDMNGIKVYDLRLDDSGMFGNKVIGYAQNNTSQAANIIISFRFYDADNVQIGTENFIIEQLAAGSVANVDVSSLYVPYHTVRFDVSNISVADTVIYY